MNNAGITTQYGFLFQRKAFAFCLGQDILGFGEALFIVADDHPALPTTILAKSYSSFAVLSFSCHGFHSSPNRSVIKSHTVFAACFCISPVTWV